MGDLQHQLTTGIGSFFGASAVQFGLKLILVYIVAIWLAAAFWAFRDMAHRSESPAMPYVAAAIVILFSPVLFPFGLLVYRIIRPDNLVAERRQMELSQALLVSELGEIEQCAGCRRIVEADWMVCPNCRTELRERCPNCDGIAEFDWLSCAWCGRDLGRAPNVEAPSRREPAAARRQPVPVMDDEAVAAGNHGQWRGLPPRVAVASSSPEPASRSRRQ